METGKYTNIIFDLDGTLTDPGVGITNSILYALKKFGIEAERGGLYRFIGPPLRESFGKYFGFSREKAEEAVRYYREYFSEKGIFENEPYPGILDLLSQLSANGRSLYVATSKPHEYAVRILEHFDMLRFFEFISGSNMDGSMSLKSDLVARVISEAGAGDLSGFIMIGDRFYDIEGAKFHGMDSMGVLYGYGELSELREASPTYLIKMVEEMPGILLE